MSSSSLYMLRYSALTLWRQEGLSHHLYFLTSGHSDAQDWASECPDVKNYKWWLNPAWNRMLYNCTHVAPLGIEGLNRKRREREFNSYMTMINLLLHWSTLMLIVVNVTAEFWFCLFVLYCCDCLIFYRIQTRWIKDVYFPLCSGMIIPWCHSPGITLSSRHECRWEIMFSELQCHHVRYILDRHHTILVACFPLTSLLLYLCCCTCFKIANYSFIS